MRRILSISALVMTAMLSFGSGASCAEATLPTISLGELTDHAPRKTTLILFTGPYCLMCAYEDHLLAERAAAYPRLRIARIEAGLDTEIPRILIKLPGYSGRETHENVTVLLTEQNVDAFLSARVKAGEQFEAIVNKMAAARTEAYAEADVAIKTVRKRLKVLDARERAAYQVDAPALRRLAAIEDSREKSFRDRIARIQREMAEKVGDIEKGIDQQHEKARDAVLGLVPEYVSAYQNNDQEKMRAISDRAYALTKDFRDRELELKHAYNDLTEPFYTRIRAMNTEIDESPEPQETEQVSALLKHRDTLLAPIQEQQKPLNERVQQAMLAADAKLDVFRRKLVEMAKSDERAAQNIK